MTENACNLRRECLSDFSAKYRGFLGASLLFLHGPVSQLLSLGHCRPVPFITVSCPAARFLGCRGNRKHHSARVPRQTTLSYDWDRDSVPCGFCVEAISETPRLVSYCTLCMIMLWCSGTLRRKRTAICCRLCLITVIFNVMCGY